MVNKTVNVTESSENKTESDLMVKIPFALSPIDRGNNITPVSNKTDSISNITGSDSIIPLVPLNSTNITTDQEITSNELDNIVDKFNEIVSKIKEKGEL
jgi:hypothetical protein